MFGYNENTVNVADGYNKYMNGKEKIREETVRWQMESSKKNYSMDEMEEWRKYFKNKAVRYGLVNEFRENGII